MKRSLTDYPLAGKRVLVRVDFNVPLEDGRVADDTRIRAALPTISYLLDQGCSVVLMSHLGRPKGQVVDGLRMAPVAARLSELLGRPVATADDCVGPAAAQAAAALRPGDVLLLENLRFHAEETGNDAEFARQLAALGDVYVNDAFGTAHRAHASTEGVTHYLPSVAGLLMTKELEVLGRLLRDPARPFVVVLGGLKVSDKISLIRHMLTIADTVLIGGAMANAFLAAKGYEVGASKGAGDEVTVAGEILAEADAAHGRSRHPHATSWWRARRSPARRRGSRRPTASPPTRWRSTSARRRRPSSCASCAAPAPSTGTAPWACSRSTSSAPARGPSARRSPAASPSRSPAAATRCRPSARSAWRAASPTSPPAAAPPWNSSRAGRCPAWRRSWIAATAATTAGAARSWRATGRCTRRRPQTKDVLRPPSVPLVAGVDDRDVLLCPPAVVPRDGARRDRRQRRRGRRPDHALRRRGRLHRRDGAGHARRARRALRHPRALRAPPVLRRERRRPGAQGAGGARRRPAARALLRRDARGARGRPDREQGRRPARRRPRRGQRRPSSPRWPSPTSPSGPSAPASRRRPSRRRRRWPSAAARVRERFGDAADGVRILYGGSVKAGQHRRAHGAAGHRRRARRRRQPRPAGVRPHRHASRSPRDPSGRRTGRRIARSS